MSACTDKLFFYRQQWIWNALFREDNITEVNMYGDNFALLQKGKNSDVEGLQVNENESSS